MLGRIVDFMVVDVVETWYILYILSYVNMACTLCVVTVCMYTALTPVAL